MEYSLDFARVLIDAAQRSRAKLGLYPDAKRAVLYLSLLSIEISLKYLLEKAGVPVADIRKQSHKLEALLDGLGKCEVRSSIGADERWVPASRIRSRVVNPAYHGATIGSLLEGESKGASKYPNEIRYGDSPHHFPSELMLECAVKVVEWAQDYSGSIRMGTVTKNGEG